ncbi:protein phosphatase 2C domain-containing protein [Actinosynnema sp. NPDC047251]|uniref:Protein serine/threonine phosphatase n=1 Tax=Saccharothrix espanaensis (strain ATCC 51144 / DSM 44229 / JCM 9112 / NBRC 15066 / NRRL 15764) TaxID=1179773 RepID=K0JP99_SACES|nr:protein phosphatase 2C domain-containing protein [Saccharothrix espanaensis]CCH28420.1 Protein serine/threonine phosphatase [Saccharothrix espanaensis DSM 44229]
MARADGVRAGAASEVGRVRSSNEDSLLVGAALFAVADGMGGHAAGEVASAMAVEHLRELDRRAELRPDDIRETLAEANRAIRAAGLEHPEQAGMGATATGLGLVRFAGSPHWVVFNIGDSRVYRYAGGVLTLLTVDHSEAAEMVAAGALTEEQARYSRFRNVITRALGVHPSIEPDQWVFPPVAGERFVLCSDGLTGELEDDEIAAVLRDVTDPECAAGELVRRAVDAGGRDNVTVVVVDYGPGDDAPADTVPRTAP